MDFTESSRPGGKGGAEFFSPFERLKELKIKVPSDGIAKTRQFEGVRNFALPAVAVILVILAGVTAPMFFRMARTATLLVLKNQALEKHRPFGFVRALHFVSLVAGSNTEIYIGTEGGRILSFDGRNFSEDWHFHRLIGHDPIMISTKAVNIIEHRRQGAIWTFDPNDSQTFLMKIGPFLISNNPDLAVDERGAVYTFSH